MYTTLWFYLSYWAFVLKLFQVCLSLIPAQVSETLKLLSVWCCHLRSVYLLRLPCNHIPN
jgi:hypothetical protein